jgi:hypothetical protein
VLLYRLHLFGLKWASSKLVNFGALVIDLSCVHASYRAVLLIIKHAYSDVEFMRVK